MPPCKQEAAANATMKFREPQLEKLRRLSAAEDRAIEEQVKYWQNDLRKREERKKRLEDERLAAVLKQRDELRVR